MPVHRIRVVVRRGEVVEAVDILEGGRTVSLALTYYAWHGGVWRPVVRWDDGGGEWHVDRYDESGTHRDRTPCPPKSLEAAVHLAQMYRRNLAAMDLREL